MDHDDTRPDGATVDDPEVTATDQPTVPIEPAYVTQQLPATEQQPPSPPPPVPVTHMAWPNPSSTPATVVKARRRWPWATAVGVLLVAAGALGWYGYDTREAAKEWERTAQTWETRAGAQEARAIEAEDLAADVADQLEASEADVAELEGRVTELAAEKAAVADERELAEGQRDVFLGISAIAADAASQLSDCVAEQSYFYGLLIDAGTYTDWAFISSVGDAAAEVCRNAYAAVDELDSALASSGL